MSNNTNITPAPRSAPSITIKPVSVRPAIAWQMLGVGKTKGYEEILPQLESYLDGNVRLISVKSIEDYHARKLAGGTAGRKPMPDRRKRHPQSIKSNSKTPAS